MCRAKVDERDGEKKVRSLGVISCREKGNEGEKVSEEKQQQIVRTRLLCLYGLLLSYKLHLLRILYR